MPSPFAAAVVSFYARTRYAADMIQHAGSGRGTCRVFTSGARVLQVRGRSGGHVPGVGARQQRGALVHAVGGHVDRREEGRAEVEAPSLCAQRWGATSGGWLVVAELLRSGSPGDGALERGGAPRRSPPLADMALGPGGARVRGSGAEHCAHQDTVVECGLKIQTCIIILSHLVLINDNK